MRPLINVFQKNNNNKRHCGKKTLAKLQPRFLYSYGCLKASWLLCKAFPPLGCGFLCAAGGDIIGCLTSWDYQSNYGSACPLWSCLHGTHSLHCVLFHLLFALFIVFPPLNVKDWPNTKIKPSGTPNSSCNKCNNTFSPQGGMIPQVRF